MNVHYARGFQSDTAAAAVHSLSAVLTLSSSAVGRLSGSRGRRVDLVEPDYNSHLLGAAMACIRNRCKSIVNQIVATKLKHRDPGQLHVDVPLESYCMAALFSPRITFTVMLSGSENVRQTSTRKRGKIKKERLWWDNSPFDAPAIWKGRVRGGGHCR